MSWNSRVPDVLNWFATYKVEQGTEETSGSDTKYHDIEYPSVPSDDSNSQQENSYRGFASGYAYYSEP
jgi:hypothetical protein